MQFLKCIRFLSIIFAFCFHSLANSENLIVDDINARFEALNIDVKILNNFTQDGVETYLVHADETSSSSVTLDLSFAAELVQDRYDHSGLSSYLGASQLINISPQGKIVQFKPSEPKELSGWVGYKGRFEFFVISSETGSISIKDENLYLKWPENTHIKFEIATGRQDSTVKLPGETGFDVNQLQYAHLWKPLRVLSHWIEGLLKFLNQISGFSWGSTIILLAIVMKVLLLPLTYLTKKFQNEVNNHKTALKPIFQDIKKNYKGEVAHKKTMQAYKDRGITPYFTLKPMIITLLTLPILIAIFNVLGETVTLQASSYLWVDDIAYPDQIARLGFSVPFLGSTLSLMPFLMAAVTIVSAYLTPDFSATNEASKSQRRNLFFMAVFFFVLFYPFPFAMVFYWTVFNLIQIPLNYVRRG